MDFETHKEGTAAREAFRHWDYLTPWVAWKAGWLASRAYHRQRDEREISASVQRIGERGDG